MISTINSYRGNCCKQPVEIDGQQNQWCTNHCWEMARQNKIFHAIPEYLNSWSEIVAECWQYSSWSTVEKTLIELIDSSPDHKRIILNSNRIGYGIIAFNKKVYLTIRGLE